ncbi:MAP kinase kinase Wis1 [Recurvomyces mirabilis]|nr:MAP kinase kinase Wis1 [Recurvomyces mirabilis]
MASPDESMNSLDAPSPPTAPEEIVSPLIGSPTSQRPPPPRMASDMTPSATVSNMSASSQPLGNINAARRPPPMAGRGGAAAGGSDIAARMRAFHQSRQNTPTPGAAGRQPNTPGAPPAGGAAANPGFAANLRLPPMQRPGAQPAASSPAVPGVNPAGRGMSLAEKRGMKMPGGLPGAAAPPAVGAPGAPAGRKRPGMTLGDMNGGAGPAGANGEIGGQQEKPKTENMMEKYSEFIDTKNGALTFKNKATINADGIEFTNGKSFHISLDEIETMDELGKGNYGTVYKVRHARPKFRKAGLGLAGNKAIRTSDRASEEDVPPSPTTAAKAGGTGLVMAMKEMRLELDDAKFASIVMELDILHRCISPYIVDFYGAFFQEGCVYICMENMDGGSMDKLYGDGVPEGVLRKVTYGAVLGLKSLKEEHNIIHRDVKPTNILINTRGQVKLCDFGVSGNLVASIAKTNIGCQSYMAPERISGGGMASAGAAGGTYSVQSDIWSLGLTIIECAMGRYPYPPETYDNIFSQLSAIVDGVPPDLPADQYSEAARDFTAGCLNKIPKARPTYPNLLQHAWLAPLAKPETITEEDEDEEAIAEKMAATSIDPKELTAVKIDEAERNLDRIFDKEVSEWVIQAIDKKKRGVLGQHAKPALHAAPLHAVGTPKGGQEAAPAVAVQPVAVDA